MRFASRLSISFLVSLVFMALFRGVLIAQEEKLTITTYYPSPYGIYQNLRMNPSTNPGDCSGASAPLGKMYFDSTLNALFVCSRVGATYGYQLVPGGGGAWAVNANDLYVMDTAMNVGIGTTAPLGKAEILYPLNSKGIYFTSPGYDTDSLNAAITFHSQTNSGQQGDVVIYHNGVSTAPGLEIWGYPSDHSPSSSVFNTHFGINGTVGIGTRTPAYKLDVRGEINATQAIHFGSGGTYQAGSIYSDANWGMILRAKQRGAAAAFMFANDTNVELMRMQDSGNVGIGTTPRSYARLDVNTTGSKAIYTMDAANGGLMLGYQGSTIQARTTSNGNTETLRLQRWGGIVFVGSPSPGAITSSDRLFVDGDTHIYGQLSSSAGVCTGSDVRWKENIMPIDDPLEKIVRLRGVEFSWKRDKLEDKNFPHGKQIGMIAQEVEKEFPELVMTDARGYKSLAYDKMTAVLIEAVKSQQKEIEELKVRLDKLEKK